MAIMVNLKEDFVVFKENLRKAYDSVNFLGCDMTGNVTFVTTYRKPTLELSTVHILPIFYGLKIDF